MSHSGILPASASGFLHRLNSESRALPFCDLSPALLPVTLAPCPLAPLRPPPKTTRSRYQ